MAAINFFNALARKLAGFALLFATLAFVFTLILGAVAYTEPAIVQYTVTGTGSLSFLTAAEAAHMHDVALVVRSGMFFALAVLVYLVLYAQWQPLNKSLVRDALIMNLVFILLLLPFQYTFTWFHKAFFPQGNWQFPADSWLITHFSEQFFFTVALCWVLGTALLLVLLTRVLSDSSSKH